MQSNYEVYIELFNELKDNLDKLSSENSNILERLDKYIEINNINKFEENKKNLIAIQELISNIQLNIDSLNINVFTTLISATENLNNTINEEIEKVNQVVSDTNEFLNYSVILEKDILDEHFENIISITDKIFTMLQSINTDLDEDANMIDLIIRDKVSEEKNQINVIKEETLNIMSKNHKVILEDNLLSEYGDFLRVELDKTNDILFRLKNMYANNKAILTNSESISLGLLIDILEEQQEGLSNSYSEIESFLDISKDKVSKKEDINEEENENNVEKNDGADDDDDIVSILNNDNLTQEQIIEKIVSLCNKQKEELDCAREELEDKIYGIEKDGKEKDTDTLKYKNYSSMLNKSFWEARYLASLDDIKYPSALYEKTVKEYQNNYLIENYNISLVAVEDYIEEYKSKYSSDIYMDEIYEQALSLLKDESNLSVKELCDETNGLSILDNKAYDLLRDDLNEVIKEIRLVKLEENIDESVDITEYNKSLRINKLLDRKNIIEKQLYELSKRAEKLEEK